MGNSVGSGLATPPKQMSQTESQLERARMASKALFETISVLSEKLKPALRRQSPREVGSDSKEEKLTDIAEAIKGLGNDFGFANNQLRDLIGRLEI